MFNKPCQRCNLINDNGGHRSVQRFDKQTRFIAVRRGKTLRFSAWMKAHGTLVLIAHLDYTSFQYDWTKNYTSLSWDGRKDSPMRLFNNRMYGVEMGSPSRNIFNVSKRKPDVRVLKISIRWGINGLSERSSDHPSGCNRVDGSSSWLSPGEYVTLCSVH